METGREKGREEWMVREGRKERQNEGKKMKGGDKREGQKINKINKVFSVFGPGW